ncbi:MAG TPA: YcjX family protein [Stellaceae bacterium]|nr:YcjX family protein [Stellaceae bacterium]
MRLAVTGLSGSGKTAFITSLVANLLSTAGRTARLPFLRAASERRLFAVRVTQSTASSVARFPLENTIAALAGDPPRWPPSTTGLRRLDLSMRFCPGGVLGPGTTLGRLAGGIAELSLEIFDYPGEWLLDLPMLGQNYEEWSRATLELVQGGARAALARDWLGFIGRHPPDSRSDAQTAQQAHNLYRTFLGMCRTEQQLSLLQPGRFLNPGEVTDASLLGFCPLPLAAGTRASSGSLAAVMEARFDAYKRNVVQPFFLQLARGVDRQIVLVDVLRALNAGEEAFTDHRRALETVLDTFRYSRRSLLHWLFGARIDRVLFAATKSDHVPALQRDHLAALVADMVAAPTLRAERTHSQVAATALASIRCTDDGTDVIDGRKVDVVIGLPQDRQRRIRFFPGIVPVTPPPAGFWGERFTEFPVFQPPRLDDAAAAGIPHINLDKALDFLLGDMLA